MESFVEAHPALVSGILVALLLIAVGLAVGVNLLLRKFAEQRAALGRERQRTQWQDEELAKLSDRHKALEGKLAEESSLHIQKLGVAESQLTDSDERARKLADELMLVRKLHPEMVKVFYKIAIFGITGSGKSWLAKKLSDVTFTEESAAFGQTRVQTYEHGVAVQENFGNKRVTQHLFRITEWGGEFLPKGLADMVAKIESERRQHQDSLANNSSVDNLIKIDDREFEQIGFRAIIFTVDLGDVVPNNAGAQKFSTERIEKQSKEYFDPGRLEFFFTEQLTQHCKTVILFINKCDLIGYDEQRARREYAPLIEGLERLSSKGKIEFTTVIGSATEDFHTRKLFSLLVRRILPEADFDSQMSRSERPAQSGQSRYGSLARIIAGGEDSSSQGTNMTDNKLGSQQSS
jgi:GTPase SAR1 family protein